MTSCQEGRVPKAEARVMCLKSELSRDAWQELSSRETAQVRTVRSRGRVSLLTCPPTFPQYLLLAKPDSQTGLGVTFPVRKRGEQTLDDRFSQVLFSGPMTFSFSQIAHPGNDCLDRISTLHPDRTSPNSRKGK